MTAPIWVDNELVGAAKMNSLPKGVLGYAETSSNQTGVTTEVDLTGLSVTVDVAANRRIRISGQVKLSKDGTASRLVVQVKESTNSFGRIADNSFSANAVEVISGAAIITPSSGSHTYKLTLTSISGAGSTVSTDTPGWILVEDIGGV